MKHCNRIKLPGLLALLLASQLALMACSERAGDAEVTPETVVIDGSSTVFPISQSAASRYMRKDRTAHIVVNFSGTTAGFRRFCAGEIDIANASRAINAEETAACAAAGVDFLVLPLAKDPMAIVVHRDNRWAEDITIQELRQLWQPEAQGKITRWSQVRAGWPDEEIQLFGRGKDSGTFDFFTSTVVGRLRAVRADYVGSEDEAFLAAQIASTPGALGFFGIGAYHRHWEELKLLAIDGGEGPVYPTLETVNAGQYKPLTRPLFLYVNQASAASKPVLTAFVQSYLGSLRTWIHHTGFLPLTAEAYEQPLQAVRALSSP